MGLRERLHSVWFLWFVAFSIIAVGFLSRSVRTPSVPQQLKSTVLVTLSGRLGNQLFQVAASEFITARIKPQKVLFLRNNYSAETDFSQGVFRDLKHVNSVSEACRGLRRNYYSHKRMSCSHVRRNQLKGECLIVEGLFQCPHFANAGSSLVRSLFESSLIASKAEETYRSYAAVSPASPVVAIHIRRGDYTKRFNRNFLEPLPMKYYIRATKFMPKNAIYLVFSDDTAWCKSNLPELFRKIPHSRLIFVKETDASISLALMSLADHFIIANSTFSWWAAFLGRFEKKIVVSPKNWFGDRVTEKNKIYPRKWIRV